jgi:hypothetical protein
LDLAKTGTCFWGRAAVDFKVVNGISGAVMVGGPVFSTRVFGGVSGSRIRVGTPVAVRTGVKAPT